MEEWKEYKISEIIEEIAMGPFGSNIKVDNFIDFGIPVLNGSNLQGFKLNEDSFNYVSEEKADSLGRANAFRGDVVITHRGTLGQIVYIPLDSKYERYIISQSQFRLRLNQNIIRPDFFVYFFHTRIGQHRILMNASQVGVPALARPTSTFKEITIPVPPMEIQNRVMAILLSLDDKIELNRRINENLEQQAQALFDFYFIQHLEKLGNYESGNLIDIANYTNGLAMQRFRPRDGEKGMPVLKIKELGQGKTDSSSDVCTKNIPNEYIVNDGDIIFSWSGTLMVHVWCGGLCGLNQHLFKVTSDKYPKWYYYFWTKYHLGKFIRIAKDKAVTMGHIKRGDLETSEVLIPEKETLLGLDKIISPILNQIIGIRCENNNLENLRDTLLPKLMSGELKINDFNN